MNYHITVEDLHEILESRKETILLIDVREHHEWESGHIEGALHIPLAQLETASFSFEGVQKIIFQCRSGIRSQTACALMRDHIPSSISIFSLTGGILAWNNKGYGIVARTV